MLTQSYIQIYIHTDIHIHNHTLNHKSYRINRSKAVCSPQTYNSHHTSASCLTDKSFCIRVWFPYSKQLYCHYRHINNITIILHRMQIDIYIITHKSIYLHTYVTDINTSKNHIPNQKSHRKHSFNSNIR